MADVTSSTSLIASAELLLTDSSAKLSSADSTFLAESLPSVIIFSVDFFSADFLVSFTSFYAMPSSADATLVGTSIKISSASSFPSNALLLLTLSSAGLFSVVI